MKVEVSDNYSVRRLKLSKEEIEAINSGVLESEIRDWRKIKL